MDFAGLIEVPRRGPHAGIRHDGFRMFWGLFFPTTEAVSVSKFVSQLSSYMSALVPPGLLDYLEYCRAQQLQSTLVPSLEYGFGLDENEIIALFRGGFRGGLLDNILYILDVDHSGVITTLKTDRSTRILPVAASLPDSLYILGNMRGRYVLPSPSLLFQTELIIMSEAAGNRKEFSSRKSVNSSHDNSSEPYVVFNSFAYCENEIIGNSNTQKKIEYALGNVGWSLILGEPGQGKTCRVLSACRSYITSLISKFSSGNIALSLDQNVNLVSYAIDAIYIDLRGAITVTDILSCFMIQAGLYAKSYNEMENVIKRFLSRLKYKSILIFDHVNDDSVCHNLVSLFDTLSTSISIIVVGNEFIGDSAITMAFDAVKASYKLAKLLGDRLIRSTIDGMERISIVYITELEFPDLLQLVYTNLSDTPDSHDLVAVNEVCEIARGNPSLALLLLQCNMFYNTDVVSIKKYLHEKRSSGSSNKIYLRYSDSGVNYLDMISSCGRLGEDEKLLLNALYPLYTIPDIFFSVDLCWVLCRDCFEAIYDALLQPERKVKFDGAFNTLVKLRIISPHHSLSTEYYLTCTFTAGDAQCVLPHKLGYTIDRNEQCDKYFHYWANNSKNINNLVGVMIKVLDFKDDVELSHVRQRYRYSLLLQQSLLVSLSHIHHLFALLVCRTNEIEYIRRRCSMEEDTVSIVSGVTDTSVDMGAVKSKVIRAKINGSISSVLDDDSILNESQLDDDAASFDDARSYDTSLNSLAFHFSATSNIVEDSFVRIQRESKRISCRNDASRFFLDNTSYLVTYLGGYRCNFTELAAKLVANTSHIGSYRLPARYHTLIVAAIALAYPTDDCGDSYKMILNELGSLLVTCGRYDSAKKILSDAVTRNVEKPEDLRADDSDVTNFELNDYIYATLANTYRLNTNYVEALEIYDRLIAAYRGVLQEKKFDLVGRDRQVLRRLGIGYYLQFIRNKGDSFLSQIQNMVSTSSGVAAFSKDIKFSRQMTSNIMGESVEVLVPSVQLSSRRSRRVDDEATDIDGSKDEKKIKFLFSCAIDAYEEVVSGYKQLYGEHAVPIAEVYLSIGDLMFSLGKYAEAKAQYVDALEMFRKLHDAFLNVGIADALYGIASSMKQSDEMINPTFSNGENVTTTSIRQLLEQALQLYQLFYSDDHAKVLSCTSLLATLLTDQMKYEKAIGMYEDALASARKSIAMLNSNVDSEDNEGIAMDNRVAMLAPLLITLASLYDKTGAYSMALPLYEEALNVYRDIFESDDPNCAETMCLLALCYNKDGISAKKRLKNDEGILYAAEKYEKAINVLDNALEIYDGANLRESFIYVRALKIQASIHASSNKYHEARACFDEIYEIYKTISIGPCVELAEMLVEYAKLMCVYDDPLEGRVLYQQAVQIYRGIYGEMNENIGSIYYAIGDVEFGLEEYENALPFYEDAILVYSQTLGNTSLKVADCHNSIGVVLQKLNEYDEAREAYREALVIYVMHHGEDHMDVAKVTNNLGTLSDDLGEMVTAKFFYDQALQIVGRCKNGQNELNVDAQSIVALDNFVSLSSEEERNAGIVTGDVEMKEKQIQVIINSMEKKVSYMATEVDDKSRKSNCITM